MVTLRILDPSPINNTASEMIATQATTRFLECFLGRHLNLNRIEIGAALTRGALYDIYAPTGRTPIRRRIGSLHATIKNMIKPQVIVDIACSDLASANGDNHGFWANLAIAAHEHVWQLTDRFKPSSASK